MLARAATLGREALGLRRAALALVVVVAATTAQAQTSGVPGTGGCAQHQSALAMLPGLTEPEAVTAMEGMPGIRTVRVAGPGAPMTRDFRPERVTLLLRDGKVDKVVCG